MAHHGTYFNPVLIPPLRPYIHFLYGDVGYTKFQKEEATAVDPLANLIHRVPRDFFRIHVPPHTTQPQNPFGLSLLPALPPPDEPLVPICQPKYHAEVLLHQYSIFNPVVSHNFVVKEMIAENQNTQALYQNFFYAQPPFDLVNTDYYLDKTRPLFAYLKWKAEFLEVWRVANCWKLKWIGCMVKVVDGATFRIDWTHR